MRGAGRVTTKGNEAELETPWASVAVTEIVYMPGAAPVPLSHPKLVSEKFSGSPEAESA
jgi:hypothetical protein